MAGSGIQAIACGGDMAASRGGEEFQVLGGPGGQVLGQQGCSPASRKPLLAGSAKNSLVTFG